MDTSNLDFLRKYIKDTEDIWRTKTREYERHTTYRFITVSLSYSSKITNDWTSISSEAQTRPKSQIAPMNAFQQRQTVTTVTKVLNVLYSRCQNGLLKGWADLDKWFGWYQLMNYLWMYTALKLN